jgi:regulator of protease activity HflC (stomatin/prohibitin superfamily)
MEEIKMVTYIILGFIVLFFIITLAMTFFTVEQQTFAVVQRLGKFNRIANPGLILLQEKEH